MRDNNNPKFKWNICGHKNIVHFLQSSISTNRLAHAYLFVGPSHLGKKTIAKEFVNLILCQRKEGLPCGRCSDCIQMKKGIHPDVYLLKKTINEKTEKQRREIIIDQARDLKAKLQQGTLLNGYKIALIYDAQCLNPNAANALLKILEEPAPKTILILIADNASNLPQTIASRCQIIKFLPVATEEIKEYINNDDIARQSHGRPGIAINVLNNKEFSNNIKENVKNFFEVVELDMNSRFTLVDDMLNWDKDETINIALANNLLNNWQDIIRDIILVKNGNNDLVANSNYLTDINKYALKFDFQYIKKVLDLIKNAKNYFYQNISAKSVLENLIINL